MAQYNKTVSVQIQEFNNLKEKIRQTQMQYKEVNEQLQLRIKEAVQMKTQLQNYKSVVPLTSFQEVMSRHEQQSVEIQQLGQKLENAMAELAEQRAQNDSLAK